LIKKILILRRENSRLLCVVVSLSLFLLFVICISNNFRNRYFFSTWAYGDCQMLNAGFNFKEKGFVNLFFLPQTNPGVPHGLIENNGPLGLYSHYPALHALILGGICKSLQIPDNPDGAKCLKFISQWFFFICACIGIMLMAKFWLKYLSPERVLLLLFLCFGSNYFLNYSYSLCDQPLNILFLGIYLICMWSSKSSCIKKKRIAKVCTLFVVFLASRNSIELSFFFISFIIGDLLLNKNRNQRNQIGRLLAVMSASFLIQFIQSYLSFGDIQHFFQHWSHTYSTKLSSMDFSKDFLINFYEYIGWYQVIVIAAELTALFVIQRNNNKDIFFNPEKITKIANNAIIFSISIILFSLLFQQQNWHMRWYSAYYYYLAFITLTLSLFEIVIQCKLWPRKLKLIINCLQLFWLAVLLFQFEKNIRSAANNNISSQAKWFWGFQENVQKQIESWRMNNTGDLIFKSTCKNDIVIMPSDYLANSMLEVNPVFEYLSRRHLIRLPKEYSVDCLIQQISNDIAKVENMRKEKISINIYLFQDPDNIKHLKSL